MRWDARPRRAAFGEGPCRVLPAPAAGRQPPAASSGLTEAVIAPVPPERVALICCDVVRTLGKLRALAGACGPSVNRQGDGENSGSLTPASGARPPTLSTSPPTWPAAATSLPTWSAVATSLPTWPAATTSLPAWWVVSRVRRLARRPEPARPDPARRAGAAQLPGGAQAPHGRGPRWHRRTRQSRRAQQPTHRGGEQARESTQPCRLPKQAQRGGHPHPPGRLPGGPAFP